MVQKTCTTFSTNQTQDWNQSWLRDLRFPHYELFVFILNSYWLVVIYSFALIGCYDYFWFVLRQSVQMCSMRVGVGSVSLTSVWPDVENHTMNFDKWKTCTTFSTNQTQDWNQSWLRDLRFPHYELFVFILNSYWLVVIYSFALIGCYDYFWFVLRQSVQMCSMRVGVGSVSLTSVWPDVENHTMNFDKWNNAFRIQPDVLKFCQKFRL